MKSFLDQFEAVVRNPHQHLRKWKKETGGKIVGCFPMYVPEEIVHAAGVLPVTLLGSDDPITMADRYTHPYVCQLVRGNFDLSLRGELDLLDGVIFSDFCLTVQMISDIWIHHRPEGFYHQLVLPKNIGARYTVRHLQRQYHMLKTALEKLNGSEITEGALRHSIAVYNENRRLLHRLYELRRIDARLFRARDVANVVGASMLMPKEEHSRLLAQLLDQVEAPASSNIGKAKVLLSGYLCDMPELDVLDLLEELGAVVTDDDFYVGRRYFHTLTDEQLPPTEALARRYVDDVPCPTRLDAHHDWGGYLANLAKQSQAEAVINVALKYCEAHQFEIPPLRASLSEKGIPTLIMETAHDGATEQTRTRFQAFLETL